MTSQSTSSDRVEGASGRNGNRSASIVPASPTTLWPPLTRRCCGIEGGQEIDPLSSLRAAVDFFTVPTINFRNLYCFIVLLHDRRDIIHFNVTANPTSEWTALQIINAFPYDTAPKYLLRDRDGVYGEYFRNRIEGMLIEEVITAPSSPFQNPYINRVIGSIRRECLNHLIILNEDHLRRILLEYFDYYHNARPHQSLDSNSPNPRKIESQSNGKVIALPQVGGMHHLYRRVA